MLAQLAHIRRFLGLAAFVSVAAAAAPPTFQITELFSNLDGSVQFIRLTETAGLDGQNNFAGLILTSSHNGVEKTFKFQADLPTQQTAHRSIVVVAIEGTLLVPVNFGERIWFCCYRADFYMPPRFLATDGGTLDFAGVDRLLFASDHPWVDPRLIAGNVKSLRFPAEDEKKIFSGNARNLFKLTGTKWSEGL